MGKAIQKYGWKRSDLVISTKLFWAGRGPNDCGLSRKHIIEGTDASLARLNLKYVDLLYAHRPDSDTPMEETVRAFNHVIDQGKAFYWGTSEWSAAQIMEAHAVASRLGLMGPVMEQPQYNMFERRRVELEYAPIYKSPGLGTTIWSPLASGLLTGKYNDGIPEGARLSQKGDTYINQARSNLETEEGKSKIQRVRRLAPIAEKLGCTQAQLALAWCLRNPHVSSVITGASRPQQIQENIKALTVYKSLTDDLMKEIDEILGNAPQPVPNYRNRS